MVECSASDDALTNVSGPTIPDTGGNRVESNTPMPEQAIMELVAGGPAGEYPVNRAALDLGKSVDSPCRRSPFMQDRHPSAPTLPRERPVQE